MTEQTYELANYDRVLRFRGELVGHASSREASSDMRDQIRWSEVDIYKTQGGSYVLHKLGKSDVYHGGRDECGKHGGREYSPRAILRWEPAARESLVPCPKCKPGPWEFLERVKVEQDRGAVFVSNTAAGLVSSAYTTDDQGSSYMTRVAKRALDQAAQADDSVREAWTVETIL